MLYALGEPGGWLKEYSPALVAVALITYVILHGKRRYGGAVLGRFMLIVFAIAWFFETLGVITGFPFGNYHYTDVMAPYLWHVPIFVLPAYALMGYVSWSLATILLARCHAQTDRIATFAVPLIAAGAMVIWDLSMDPLRATVEGRWVWQDGGMHMGVPISNYIGWFGVTWLMFQIFALYLRTLSAKKLPTPPVEPHFWLSVPLAYVVFATEYLLNPFFDTASQQAVMVQDILVPVQSLYLDTAIVCLMTMIPLAFMGILSVFRGAAGGINRPILQRATANTFKER